MVSPRLLVISQGPSDSWQQIALAHQAAGCRVAFTTLRPGLAESLAAEGESFDAVLTNQESINTIAVALRDNRNIDWRRTFRRFVMVQYHDIFRELPTLQQASYIFGWYSIPLVYQALCPMTADFLAETGLYGDVVRAPMPFVHGKVLDPARSAPGAWIDDVGDVIRPRAGFAEYPYTRLKDATLIYCATCVAGKHFLLRQDGPIATPEAFLALAREHAERGGQPGGFSFVADLYRRKIVNDHHVARSIAAEYVFTHASLFYHDARRAYVRRLKEAFGRDFDLFGSGWDRIGVESIPIERAADPLKYNSAFVSIDFGSQFVDLSFYQRTIQILESEGRLLQLGQADRHDVYGPFADSVCFESYDGLMARLDAAMADPARFRDEQTALRRFLEERFRPEITCRPVLERIVSGP